MRSVNQSPWMNFRHDFTRGDRTVLPSYKNFTNAEELSEDPDWIGTQPVVRAVADFNLDGFDDIIVAFHETKQLTAVMYSDGKGRFDLSRGIKNKVTSRSKYC